MFYQSYIKFIKPTEYLCFYFVSLFRFKMKDRIAGPHSVPTGFVRSSRFLLPIVHLSLRTRFPSPPPSCPPLPTTCRFYSSASFAQRTNVSPRWTLKPIADRWFPSTTSLSQGFKEVWTAPRLRAVRRPSTGRTIVRMNRRSYALLYARSLLHALSPAAWKHTSSRGAQ